MLDFTKHFATRIRAMLTPQGEPIPGSTQVPNSAGGFAWQLGNWDRLDRFLVLGSEGGTYYATERKLTAENATAVTECIAQDGPRVVARVVEMSESGRAPRNDPALFVLAMAAGMGDEATRAAALAALPRVARTGTHRTGIPAKLVVVGMASNGFTIADPNDTGMLGVVGFDAAAPQLIADFAR